MSPKRPVTINGILYESKTAAAADLDVHITTIQKLTREHDVVEHYVPRQRSVPKPVVINGESYPSMRAASRATGWARTTIRWHRQGDAPIAHTPHRPQPVALDGYVFPSIAAAARYRKMSPATLRYQIRTGQIILDHRPSDVADTAPHDPDHD